MNNNKIILYIDDDSDEWQKSLEPVAGNHGFTIIPSDSVKDGRLQLENFNAVIDCVLLDLGFPKEKLQGKDLLKEIKEKYQNLPVIILTASDKAEDLRTAVECIKLGAFDYFGKERIDLEQLFNQINNSIDSNLTKSVHTYLLKSINESDNPYIYTSAYIYNNSDLYYSHFVYKLNSIILPSKTDSAKIYAELAVFWHRDILSLNALLNMEVSLKISYRITIDKENKKKQLNIYCIFSATGLTKNEADSKANKLFLEVNFYFSHRYLYQKGFYSFVIISDEKEFDEVLSPVNKDLKVSSFVKSNISLNFNDKIDLDKYSLGLLENRIINSLGFSKPSLPSLEKFIDHLFDRLENTYFDIIAFSEKLSIDEIKFLKGLKEELSTKLLEDDYKIVSSEINRFIDYPSQMYNITALLYSEGIENNSKLIMSVANDFFTGFDSIEINEHIFNPSKLHKLFIEDYNKNEKQIINTYSYPNSVELFRLPFPKVIGHKGINPSNPVFDFLPPEISTDGPIIGTKSINASDKLIRISPSDLRKHLYILGQTGTGKSTTLFSMLMERAYSGEGFALMDPHGDLTKEVRKNIPDNRKKDIIVFDPVENNGELALNLLEYDPAFPEQKTFIINELIKIIGDIYNLDIAGGPIFEQYFRAACFLVMDDPSEKYTLQHVVTVFENAVFRKELLSKCKDESIKTLWEDIMLRTGGDYAFANFAPYITSKLTRFLNDHFLRPIITQRISSLNFRNIIDTNKILLIRLTKGRLGDVSTKFIGRILLNKLIMAAYSRENIEEKERLDFTLFIDEFQNFISSDIETAMSEARKYHLNMVLANQTVAQINKDILNSVLGNVGSMIFFRPGILDAEQIKAFFEPYFTKQEMLNLPNYTCVAKLQINNQPALPFVINTIIQEELLKIIK